MSVNAARLSGNVCPNATERCWTEKYGRCWTEKYNNLFVCIAAFGNTIELFSLLSCSLACYICVITNGHPSLLSCCLLYGALDLSRYCRFCYAVSIQRNASLTNEQLAWGCCITRSSSDLISVGMNKTHFAFFFFTVHIALHNFTRNMDGCIALGSLVIDRCALPPWGCYTKPITFYWCLRKQSVKCALYGHLWFRSSPNWFIPWLVRSFGTLYGTVGAANSKEFTMR